MLLMSLNAIAAKFDHQQSAGLPAVRCVAPPPQPAHHASTDTPPDGDGFARMMDGIQRSAVQQGGAALDGGCAAPPWAAPGPAQEGWPEQWRGGWALPGAAHAGAVPPEQWHTAQPPGRPGPGPQWQGSAQAPVWAHPSAAAQLRLSPPPEPSAAAAPAASSAESGDQRRRSAGAAATYLEFGAGAAGDAPKLQPGAAQPAFESNAFLSLLDGGGDDLDLSMPGAGGEGMLDNAYVDAMLLGLSLIHI